MRILHVIHRYPPAIGGGEIWCAGLARWQAAQGHAVRVLTLRAVEDDELWGEHPWGDDLARPRPRELGQIAVGACDRLDGVDVHRCAAAEPVYAVSRVLGRAGLEGLAWGFSAELYGLLPRAARAADVVHAYWLGGPHALAAWAAARLAHRPYVLTPFFHQGFPHHETRLAGTLLRRADRVLALTESEAAALGARGVAAARIVRAGNAVDLRAPDEAAVRRTRAALGVPEGTALLCYVGRKAPNKGLDVLLDALARVRHAPRLALAGPSTDWYRALLRARPAAAVIDLPVLSEAAKAELLAAADVLVLPSRLESFGTVFLEAWAVGTPVIGAHIAAVREVVGDAGLLFRPDDADDLAERIDDLLASADLRRALGERGRHVAALHTWDRIGATVLEAYAAAGRERAAGVPVLEERLSWK